MWVKTLQGTDVFDNGDGYIWHPIVNQWVYEPGLLTMPGLGPAVIRQSQITGGWPSLKEAWSLKTTANTDTFLLLRLWVLLVAVYLLVHLPFWVIAKVQHDQLMGSIYTGALLCVSAASCLWLIWFDHLWQVNRKKGKQVAVAAAAGYVGIQVVRHLKAIEHPDRRG